MMMSELYIDKVTQKKRAISLDLARGSMLFLIILSHLPLLLYNIEPGVATKVTGSSTMEYILNYLMELIIDNRARPLFSILFGYGLVMIYRKQTERKGVEEAQRMIKRRSWYLILFGAILAGVAGGQDILMTYGISGLLFVSFLKKNKKIYHSTIRSMFDLCTNLMGSILRWTTILWFPDNTKWSRNIRKYNSRPTGCCICNATLHTYPSTCNSYRINRNVVRKLKHTC